MKALRIKDTMLIQYLLGELPEAEQDKLEEALFEDRELFAQLEAVEDELIESYVRGELKQNDRQRFERAYLSSPTRRQKIDHAASLLASLPSEPTLLSLVMRMLWSHLRSVGNLFLFRAEQHEWPLPASSWR